MDDEAMGKGRSRRRIGGGRGGGGRQQRGDTVQVRGFKMLWRLRLDGERMDCLLAAVKERRDGGADGAVGGGGRGGGGGGGGKALPEISSDVLFAERTADGNDAMEIDGEAEAATAAEEEEYRLRAMEFSSLHRAATVRDNVKRGGGGGIYQEEEGRRRRRASAMLRSATTVSPTPPLPPLPASDRARPPPRRGRVCPAIERSGTSFLVRDAAAGRTVEADDEFASFADARRGRRRRQCVFLLGRGSETLGAVVVSGGGGRQPLWKQPRLMTPTATTKRRQ